MTLKFTTNIEQYTTSNKALRERHFMEFASKKQLEEADILNEGELAFVKSIKGTFSFALHKEERYMAITLYKAGAEKKYNFLIADLQEKAIAEVDSIKQAKAAIMELVGANTTAIEEMEDEAEEPVEEAEDQEA